MFLILKSYFKNVDFYLLLIFKHRNIVPICYHNVNTIFKKNLNINMPRCHKTFGFPSSLNTARPTIIL